MPLLLAVLRRDSGAQPLAAWPQVSEGEWPAAFALAREHNVLPSFAAQLEPSRAALPESAAALLHDAQRQVALEGFFWSQQLRGLLQAFAAAGIPVLPLKGPFLAQRLYGDAARRPCRDLDLLVTPGDVGAAEGCLRTQGFSPSPHAEDYQRSWYRQGTMVELHFGVENPLAFDLDLPGIWSRATLDSFEGLPAWRMAPEDELLYLCLHGLRHGYRRLSDVLDALRGLAATGGTAPGLPDGHALLPLLALGSLLAGHLADCTEPAGTGQPPPRSLVKRTQLAEELWQGLLTREPAPLDWAAQHRLYLRLETTPRSRLARLLRHLRILAGRTIAADYDFAARFGLSRPWQVRLLRPVRLVASRWGRRAKTLPPQL